MNSKQLANEIHSYNQQLSQLENASCENMLDTLDYLAEYLSDNGQISKQWLEVFKSSALLHVKNMLQAKSVEEFKSYEQGLQEVLATLSTPTSVDHLKMLRINNCLTTLQDMAGALTADILRLDDNKKRDLVNKWSEKWARLVDKITGAERATLMELEMELLGVMDAKTEADFFARKQKLEHRILVNPYYMHLQDAHLKVLTNICQTNLQTFAETRLDYLKQVTSKATMLQDALWITAGIGLTVAGLAVTSGTAAVVLGAAGAGYGIIDFAKESREKILNHGLPEIGKQEIQHYSTRTQNLLREEQKPASRFTLSEKVQEKLGYSLTTLGAVIAVAGLASAVFPPAAPFIMGAVALVATVAGIALYVNKVWQQRKKLKIAAKQCEAIQQGLRHTPKDMQEEESFTPEPLNIDTHQVQETSDSILVVEKAMVGMQPQEKLTGTKRKQVEANLVAMKNMELSHPPQAKKPKTNQVAATETVNISQETNNKINIPAGSNAGVNDAGIDDSDIKDAGPKDEDITPP
jgi:hypothetical protein